MTSITHAHVATGTDAGTGEVHKAEWNADHTITGSLLGTGGLVLLEQHTASSSATLDFASFISSDYDDYLIEMVNMLPATDNVTPQLRVGTGGGPTYDSGANYTWMIVNRPAGAVGGNGSSGQTSIALFDSGVSNSEPSSWSLRLFNPQSTTANKQFSGTGLVNYFSGPTPFVSLNGGVYVSHTAVTALRFLYSSGNIASGTIRIYGVAKTGGVGAFGGQDLDVSPNPTSDDHEFKSTLSGWTTIGTLNTSNANATGYKSHLHIANTATGTFQLHGLVRTMPSMPYTVTAKFSDYHVNANYQHYGLCLSDGTKFMTFGPLWQSSNGIPEMFASNWSTRTSRSSFTEYGEINRRVKKYIRMTVNSSTSVDLYFSQDGLIWTQVASGWNPSMTPTQFGVIMTGNDNSVSVDLAVDWIRFGSDVIQPESLLWQNVGGPTSTMSVRLNYGNSSTPSDVSAGAITANTWLDLCSNQSFSITDSSSIVELALESMMQIKHNTGGDKTYEARLLVDGSLDYHFGGDVRQDTSQYHGFEPSGSVKLTGLSAGTHTVKAQIKLSSAGDYYLRPSASGGFEYLRIQVTEYAPVATPLTLASAKSMVSAGDYSISSTTFANVDNTNLSHTITTGGHRVLVTFTGMVTPPGANDGLALDVSVDGVRQASAATFGIVYVYAALGAISSNISFTYMTDVLSPGSHTIALMARSIAGGANILRASTGQTVAAFSVAELAT